MQYNPEIRALLQLLDDPDAEVFDTVAGRLLDMGKGIIPNLEQLWEHTEDEAVQQRIEQLIHRVHFHDLQSELLDWSRSRRPELLRGGILVAKYHFPDLNVSALLAQFDQLRRNIWLELNNYLTPLEQVHVFNSILYNYFKLQGHELTEREPKFFFVNNTLESRQGNVYTIGILYLALAELLDIPLFAVDIPRQFVFAYIDTYNNFLSSEAGTEQVHFFVDPLNGQVYSQKDVYTYLRKINAPNKEQYFAPLSSKKIIYKLLEELRLCYQYKREEQRAEEIRQLMNILTEEGGEDPAIL